MEYFIIFLLNMRKKELSCRLNKGFLSEETKKKNAKSSKFNANHTVVFSIFFHFSGLIS